MVDFTLIEKRLNSDADYRARFLKDPVALFLSEGLLFSFETQNKLRQRVAQFTAQGGPGSKNLINLCFDSF